MINKFPFILYFCLIGCSSENELIKEKATATNKRFYIHSPSQLRKLEVIMIDGCEYLYGYVGGNGGYVLCHKGNCNNPVHIYNKEQNK